MTQTNRSLILTRHSTAPGPVPSRLLLQHRWRFVAAGIVAGLVLTGMTPGAASGADLTLQAIAYLNRLEPNLVEADDGNLLGVAHSGFASLPGGGYGDTIFRVSPQGGTSVVYRIVSSGEGFPVWRPAISLSRGRDGRIYGTTSRYGPNGYGMVFHLDSHGVVNPLFVFDFLSRIPTGALVQDGDGTLYGGSLDLLFAPLDLGKIFKLATNGTYTELFAFKGTNGSYPRALLLGKDGNLYGTSQGGPGFTRDPFSGHGTLFRLIPGGEFATLMAFNGTNGSRPAASLAQDSEGNLYGATEMGGAFDRGTLFKTTPAGEFITLHTFDGTNGVRPMSVMSARDGNLYGTTASGGVGFVATNANPASTGFGTLFRMTAGGLFTTLVFINGSSVNGSHSARPSSLIQADNGMLYGTTRGGAVFGLVPSSTLPLPSFTLAERRDTQLTLTWTAFAGGVYQIEATPSLVVPAWTNHGPVITAIGSTASYGVDVSGGFQSFYRVRRE